MRVAAASHARRSPRRRILRARLEIEELHAFVQEDNAASLRLFAAAGYSELRRREGLVELTLPVERDEWLSAERARRLPLDLSDAIERASGALADRLVHDGRSLSHAVEREAFARLVNDPSVTRAYAAGAGTVEVLDEYERVAVRELVPSAEARVSPGRACGRPSGRLCDASARTAPSTRRPELSEPCGSRSTTRSSSASSCR